MTCECPAEIFADVDNLPRPAGYSIQKSFESCALAGGYLYATAVNATSTTWKVLRWPFPALATYEEVATKTNYIGWPAVSDTKVYVISDSAAGHQIFEAPLPSGSFTLTIGALLVEDVDAALWGLRYENGMLWAAFGEYLSGAPDFQLHDGLFHMNPATAATTTYTYSSSPDDGVNAHLDWFTNVTVATDGAVWSEAIGSALGAQARTVVRMAGGTFANGAAATTRYTGHTPLCEGTVLTRDAAAGANRVLDTALVATADPCSSPRPQRFVAWDASYSQAVYAAVDVLYSYDCSCPGGWVVGAVAF